MIIARFAGPLSTAMGIPSLGEIVWGNRPCGYHGDFNIIPVASPERLDFT
jgi:hypothetical protein